MTWWAGWDYLVESVNGWAGSYIANAYVLFGRADSYIWFFGPVSVALSCCWFSKLSNGMLAAKNNVMGWQPLSKDKLVTASKQRKADLRKVRARWVIGSLDH